MFEEGSVDAVAPASQWLLRHSNARACSFSNCFRALQIENFHQNMTQNLLQMDNRVNQIIDNHTRRCCLLFFIVHDLEVSGNPRVIRVTERMAFYKASCKISF